ncbi:DUF805 domain-containing protein [Subtercola sp. RTI3]|nr:DUF805 domain-containing protein [Subtercola vilae]MEA9986846.1 DUF805 domain-containing protein [Subtercola sp. RTI3]
MPPAPPAPQSNASYKEGPVPLWAPYYNAPLGEAVRRFFKKYATFTGRASRAEYWWWALVAAVIGIVGEILLVATGAGMVNSDGTVNSISPGYVIVAIVFSLYGLATIIPTLALIVRRLHDGNYAGWFIFLGLIPFVGGIILLVFVLLPPKPEGARFDIAA